MLPGKKLSAEDILRILLHRWWLIAVPVVIGAVGALIWSMQLPNRYRSETLIMLVPQRIPDSYVKSTVTARVEDRLGTLSDQILSRSRLERIIQDFSLYSEQQRVTAMEDVVQRMRQDIKVGVEGKEFFRVAYVSSEPATAQKVAERLASLFIEENLRDRENVAEDTNQFLDSQLEDAKRRLVEQEKKLEVYRRQYSGQLPTQLPGNLQAIQNAEVQRRSLAQAVDRERERRIQLERQIAELQIVDPVAVPPASTGPANSPDAIAGGSTAQQLEAARVGLRALQFRNTADHPDVRMMQRRISELEEKLKTETSAAGQTAAPAQPVDPAEFVRQRRIREYTDQIAAVDRQLKDYEAEDARLRLVIKDYQAKVDAVPTRESELVELTRDYETLQNSYRSLLGKREESKIAANLERKNIGEQFRILDPARIPERPFSPDRRLMTLIGAGAGLTIGMLIVGGLEYRDTTFKSDDDIAQVLALPVLAVLPRMRTGAERRQHRRRILAVSVTVLAIAGSAAVALWRLRL